MADIKLLRITAGAVLLALIPAWPAWAGCPTCDTTVFVRGDQIPCLERRLQPYLKGTRDPILVSLANCDKADDQPRLDPPARILPSKPRKAPTALPDKQVYLFSRADAECVVRALAARPRKTKEFRLELATC